MYVLYLFLEMNLRYKNEKTIAGAFGDEGLDCRALS